MDERERWIAPIRRRPRVSKTMQRLKPYLSKSGLCEF
jgi:hypothetical protein